MPLLLVNLLANAQTSVQIRNLDKLAKVWGFLKYFHPEATKPQMDWDSVLLKKIALAETQSEKQFDITLDAWYQQLPSPNLSPFPTVPKGDSIISIFNEKEIKKWRLAKNLSERLIQLYQYHVPYANRYVTDKYKQYTLDFILNVENPFDKDLSPHRALRLLALMRYWNIINYQYPHKAIVPQQWHKILVKYIPLFYIAEGKESYRNVVKKLTTAIADSHSFYRDEDFDANQLLRTSFELNKFKGRYMIAHFNNQALATSEGLMTGDQLIEVNGIKVAKYVKEKLFYVNGTNRAAKDRDLAIQFFKADTSKNFNIVLKRQGKMVTVNIKKYALDALSINTGQSKLIVPAPAWKEVAPGVWHVKFCELSNETELGKMLFAIKEAKSVVFDMRGYPTYAILNQAMAALMPNATVLGHNLNANIRFPGTFIKSEEVYRPIVSKFEKYLGKMIVLVDARTQSLAESVAAQLSLRPLTLIMGSATAGTTGNVNYFDLPGGLATSFTAVGFKGTRNSFVQQKGVKIDIVVKKIKADLKNGTDRVLLRAIAMGKRWHL